MSPSSTSINNDAPTDPKVKPSESEIRYEYMFEANKRPTTQLDALLRSIAGYISRELGDKSKRELTPLKLAAFYKAVGGDYDSFLIQTDHPSISTVWKITGCQHSLQPTDNDFSFPSIPALTPRGFSRWESLELLLGPEEHVPFMQYAVKNWNLKHPETGVSFPPDLPANVFPAVADADVDRWHESCAAKLWREASREDLPKAAAAPPPTGSPDSNSKYAYFRASSLHPEPPSAARPEIRRPFSYAHVPSRSGRGPRLSTRSSERRRTPPLERDRARRRSFSDYASPTQEPRYPGTHLDPNHPPPNRGHSQPRHHSSSSDDEPRTPPNVRQGQHTSPHTPTYGRRHAPPSGPYPSSPGSRSQRSADNSKRQSMGKGNLREKLEKVSSFFLTVNTDRPHSDSRPSSYDSSPHSRKAVHRRTHMSRPTACSESDSDEMSSNPDCNSDCEHRRSDNGISRRSDNEMRRSPRAARGEYGERQRVRGRDANGGDADKDDEARRHHLRRSGVRRRTSSHDDIYRRRDMPPTWDRRDEKKKVGRRSPDDGVPLTGVGGRRYPEAVYN